MDLGKFNALVGDWAGKPVEDIRRLFFKKVILDDQTSVEVETIKSPGFIGIADAAQVTDAQGKTVSGHEDIVQVLAQYGLLISTFQWNKDRYGEPFDTRRPLDGELFIEGFIKNEGHHAGAIVPALRLNQAGNLIPSYATFNEPNHYHQGLYGKDGYVAVTQRLVFANGVTPQQARGYTNSMICWMALLNPSLCPSPDLRRSRPKRWRRQPAPRLGLPIGNDRNSGCPQCFIAIFSCVAHTLRPLNPQVWGL